MKKQKSKWTCTNCWKLNLTCHKGEATKEACKDFGPNFQHMAKELGQKRMTEIRVLQGILAQINMMQGLGDTELIPVLNRLVEQTEDALQEAWNMKVRPEWHTYWMKALGCTCPKYDNVEALGIPNNRIIAEDCPIHGKQK